MISYSLNPFRPTRWEHQRDGYQLIWFTKTAEELAEEKSIYLRGSRGSGKTTLLKSVCWEDLSRNKSLTLQKKFSDFDHLGIYVRFPDHLSTSLLFEPWVALSTDPASAEIQFHRFFSLLVELACAEKALHACHELRVENHIRLKPSVELSIVEMISSEFPALMKFSEKSTRTFIELSLLLRTVVRAMNESASRGELQRIVSLLPAREPGEFLLYITERLSQAVEINDANSGSFRSVGFKFCLDDCEVLSPQQQISINTLVRTSKYPVSWVISYVGSAFESSETFIAQQPLTDADRRVRSLDDRKEDDFRELCEAVVSLRLLFSISEDVRPPMSEAEVKTFFPLRARLRTRSINETIALMVAKSSNPIAKRLTNSSVKVRELLHQKNSRYRKRFDDHPDYLPYYETYLLMLWQGREESFQVDFPPIGQEHFEIKVDRIGQIRFEAWLRRKQRAALLQLASKLKFRRTPLAGVNVITSLADGSIRDFLEILGSIYEHYARRQKTDPRSNSSLDRFATARTPIAFDVQTDGIYDASEAYLKGVSSRSEREADTLLRFIQGLGILTSILQSNPHDPRVLGRSERGIFTVKFDEIDEDSNESLNDKVLISLIRRAEISGYLRSINIGGGELDTKRLGARLVAFRLHKRFAPCFHFSFRGAYETVQFHARDFWPLCDRTAPVDPASWANALASRNLAFSFSQLSLPLSTASNDD